MMFILNFTIIFVVVKGRLTNQDLLSSSSLGGMYQLLVSSHVAFRYAKVSPQTWHNRLGHYHLRALRQVLPGCPVSGSFPLFNNLCTTC